MFEALMDSIWEEFARLIFHVDVELQPAEVEEAFAPGDEPSDVRLSGGTEAEQPSALAEARAAAATGGAAVATAAPAAERQRRAGVADQQRDGRQGRRREDRPQRPLLVRLGEEVQEVPRRLKRIWLLTVALALLLRAFADRGRVR